ncbi:unnamed protein product [Hermetia illucens]|uniref:Uncharacterized protein n=1 Tax=Hermetia illucens TaxID=343691 RepID=A0A7R8V4W4_HERIL|nr:uncharacterized protein LOC119659412 isoform X2 [Hermetia illucens]CAD7092911.1 unnamed protein product [Hermetia illucens]
MRTVGEGAASGTPASYMKNLGDANSMAQVYGQPAFSNIPGMSGASMMGSGAAMSPYQTLGGAQMSMQPQYSIQMPQGAMALPPGAAMPGVQMYPATTPGLSGLAGSTLTPAQLAAIMKSSNAAPQPQMTSWPQYGGMPGVSYPTMSSYPARNNANSYIVDYSDGLNILDEPTGGSAYMSK